MSDMVGMKFGMFIFINIRSSYNIWGKHMKKTGTGTKTVTGTLTRTGTGTVRGTVTEAGIVTETKTATGTLKVTVAIEGTEIITIKVTWIDERSIPRTGKLSGTRTRTV